MFGLQWMQCFGTLQKSVPRRNNPARIQVGRESSGVRVEADAIESPSLLVRLATVEGRSLQFPVPSKEAGGQDAETDMRGVLPVVRQRRGQIVHGRRSVHEGDGTECRLARRRGID